VAGVDVKKMKALFAREYFVLDPMTGRQGDNLLAIARDLISDFSNLLHRLTQVDWYQDFYYPFLKKWGDRIEASRPPIS